ncbi:MAG: NADH:flavin oxidoreductase/NADH oxidase family protein [Pseudomonadales bacterium]|nr:NADH:flavin oxidoreductase/NADH oxidase family protein [Pseudomonadales bacterium]NRA16677.1 NADH:flavin oxidoreductase/NADH oxidase family protein [Oceanospirillaceae bacterium]
MIGAEGTQHYLSRPIQLPCGVVLKNRLVKSAMSDSLADGEGNPTQAQIRLYERWAEGGVALSIIGEVQGDARFPEKPGNLVLGISSNPEALHALACRASINGAHIWPQIGHAGALSHLPISRPKGPSALQIGSFKCAGMLISEVKQLPEIYAKAAKLAKDVGFTGVQIHAGHGFLLSQFLSPLFNRRSDLYGGSIEARCQIIVEVIDKVRCAVGHSFPIGIKINSSDQLEGGLTPADALEAIRMLDRTSIDLIEISGGTYFPGVQPNSGSPGGGAYFVEFCQRAQHVTSVPLVATGGFKTRTQALSSLSSGAVDMVGVARAMILNPALANSWLSETAGDPDFPRFEAPPLGGVTAWYTTLLTAVGNDNESNFALDISSAIRLYEERDALRCVKWRKKFSAL